MCPDKERKDQNSALVTDNAEEECEITLFTTKCYMKKVAKLEEIIYSGQTEVSGLFGVCCFRQCTLGHCLRRNMVDLLSRRPFES